LICGRTSHLCSTGSQGPPPPLFFSFSRYVNLPPTLLAQIRVGFSRVGGKPRCAQGFPFLFFGARVFPFELSPRQMFCQTNGFPRKSRARVPVFPFVSGTCLVSPLLWMWIVWFPVFSSSRIKGKKLKGPPFLFVSWGARLENRLFGWVEGGVSPPLFFFFWWVPFLGLVFLSFGCLVAAGILYLWGLLGNDCPFLSFHPWISKPKQGQTL